MSTLSFIIDAENRAGAVINQVQGQLDKMQPTFKKMAKVGTVAFTAVAGSMFMVGKASDDMRSTIIQGTGASGVALDGMMDIARDIAKQVPQSFGEVGNAVAEISTRLGVTGNELEGLSKEFLDFARISDMEVQPAVRQVTRLMGDWGVEVEKTGDILDILTVASQASGATIERMTELAVQYGVQFRSVGFEMEEVIAMLAKFEKEGVATKKMMGGLSMALGRMAQAGLEPREEFGQLIKRIKEAETEGEALREAIELLGARAGPDFALAVREGRFELENMMAALSNTDGAMMRTAEVSLTTTERMAMLKNQLATALMPVANQFMQVLENMVNKLTPIIEKISTWIAENEKLAGTIMKGVLAISGLVAVSGTLGLALIALKPIIAAVVFIVGLLTIKILIVSAAIAAIIAVGWYWVRNWGEMKDTLAWIWDMILDKVKSVWATIISVIKGSVNSVIGAVESMINTTLSALNAWIGALNKIINAMNRVPKVNIPNIPTAKEIELPRLAEGGIVTKPTAAIIGEAGPEAIIPLNKRMLAPVTVNINGGYYLSETVAEEIGDSIIAKLKRQMKL
jgi:TP901 family phage tail tape measure protein